jgi:alpha-D-ribose 1-methylphosphonate 5-triphosphate synthase subunit PhnG
MSVAGRNGNSAGGDVAGRQALMRACAEASEAELQAALAALGEPPEVEELRPPQVALVMLRGRIGGDGAAFNIGEATVTRAAVRLANGAVGFAYLLGRSERRARLAALLDALTQDPVCRALIERRFVEPMLARRAALDARDWRATEATKVEFFTLVRGED